MHYLSKKGQGLTEYGIILLIICTLGVGIYNASSIKDNLNTMYGTIVASLVDIAGYDTGETLTVSYTTREGKTANVILHKTRLSYQDKPLYYYNMLTSKNENIRHYTNSTTGTGQGNIFSKTLNGWGDQPVYFKASSGAYYSITPDGSSLTRYTGDTSFMQGKEIGYK